MQVKRKAVILLVLPLAISFLSGCGGFSAAPSVSPASFFMPGLLRNDPKPAALPGVPDPNLDTPDLDPVIVAQSH